MLIKLSVSFSMFSTSFAKGFSAVLLNIFKRSSEDILSPSDALNVLSQSSFEFFALVAWLWEDVCFICYSVADTEKCPSMLLA